MYLAKQAKLPVRGGPGAISAPGMWRPPRWARPCIEVVTRGLRFMVRRRRYGAVSFPGYLDSVVWTFDPAPSRYWHGPLLSIALWHLVFNCTGFSQCVRSCPVVRSTEYTREAPRSGEASYQTGAEDVSQAEVLNLKSAIGERLGTESMARCSLVIAARPIMAVSPAADLLAPAVSVLAPCRERGVWSRKDKRHRADIRGAPPGVKQRANQRLEARRRRLALKQTSGSCRTTTSNHPLQAKTRTSHHP